MPAAVPPMPATLPTAELGNRSLGSVWTLLIHI